MTPYESPPLPDPWPDVLAAYVDGALDPTSRAIVDPPQPSERAWGAVREAVHRGIDSPPIPVQPREHRGWKRTGAIVAGALAATVAAILAIGEVRNSQDETQPPDTSADPLAEYAVLPLATEADVVIERVSGNGHGLLIGDAPLALASENDVQLEEAEPHPAWPGGSPKMTTAPGDVPMIFAARLR